MSADNIKKIGIVGAGQMGSGISQVASLAGLDVYLMDIDEGQLSKAMGKIEHGFDRQIEKNLITSAQREAAQPRIETGTSYDGFSDCDLVIECAKEDEEVKKDILRKLCTVVKADAILATNTSSISITRLAAVTDRPERFLGMHFMNPVAAMELVEMIRGIATDPGVFQDISELARRMGKNPVPAEDFPAFIVNRVLMPMLNEAIYTLYEGVASVAAIDNAMKLGAHHPMGPLELSDFIGLDIILAVMNTLYEGLADTKYRPCPLLVKYVEAGWLGRKAGKGFYDYSGDGDPVPTR